MVSLVFGVCLCLLPGKGAQPWPFPPFYEVVEAGPTGWTPPLLVDDPQAVRKPVQTPRAITVRAPIRPEPSVGLLERIAQCESGGNYLAQNPHSSASGKYQVLDSTWRGWLRARHPELAGAYPHARDAPASVQDDVALWAFTVEGPAPWYPSRSCWGY